MSALKTAENLDDLILRLLREVTSDQLTEKEIREDALLHDELGVTSLGKIAIAFRLEEELGIAFSHSVKDIGKILTVKDLFDSAKRIAGGGQGAPFNQPAASPRRKEKITAYPSFVAIQNSPFVAIQPDGVKPPFYACGHHPRLINLARAVGIDRPFYKIDAYALLEERLGAGLAAEMSIEEMAARFVREILASQPAGPYYLGGGCEGAIIAFEIAQQLESLGRRVAMLIIWDTTASDYWPDEAARPAFVHRLRHLFSGGRDGLKRRLSFLLNKARSAFAPPGADLSGRRRQVEQVLMRTARAYEAKSYPGRITLFRASESDFGCPDPTLGWGPLARDGVAMRMIPGNHVTYFEQHFLNFVEALNGCLAQAQTGGLDVNFR
jgi:thioesterase domain-containing protein/acyl carrier protein